MAAKLHLQSGEGFSHWKSSTAKIPQPKFFKIILSQHECSRLRIPEHFASKYCKNMLNPVYLEVPSGEVWEVEVAHSQGQICLAIGWQNFSDFYSISCGHFLMFKYNARSHFNVTIFDLSASEIEYPYSSAHGIHTPISYSHYTRHAPERDQSESDDSVEILEGIPGSQKANAIIPDMVESSVENLDHCPLGQSRKRQRQEGNAEDDVSVDMHIKKRKVEKLQEDVASPSFIRKGQKSREGCCTHMQQSKIVYDENKIVMDKERAIYRIAKSFKSKNPFIISFMQPSYVFSPFILSMSLKFARKYLENYGNLVLRVPGRGSWSVKCTFGTTNFKIFWKAFVMDNKLKPGDVCVFEVIKGTKILMDITIFRAAGEVPGVSDSSVPLSQSRIVQTMNLKQWRGAEEHGEGTGDEHSFEILGHCPLVQYRKRKRLERYAEDDVPIDIHTKIIKVETSHKDVALPPFRKIKKEHDEGTGNESSVEILGHCPLGHDSKIKRLEEETEDDVSIDIHAKSIKVANTQEDVASPSFTRKTKKTGESCRIDKQQSKIFYDKNTTVLDKERTAAYQRAKAFKSENPYVMYFMQPSYVSTPYRLDISFLFARKYVWERCGFLVLRVPGRGSWSVKYVLGKSKTKICFYWKAFVRDNKLNFGDVCVFELIKGTKPILDVTIFRTAETKPVHKIDGKLPGVSDCKNNTIKTENSVPCSQSKIVRSRNLNLEKQQKANSDGFTSKTKEKLSEDAGKHAQQFKSSCKGSAVAKEIVLAYQRAKAFTSENPFFICFMQPSYVSSASGPMQLSITLPIARKFFATKHSDVILQNSRKRSWAVKCSLGTVNAKLTSGWKEFVLDNNIKVGDVCVFERVSRSKLLFNVIIFSSTEGM